MANDIIMDVCQAMAANDMAALSNAFNLHRNSLYYHEAIAELITEIAPNPLRAVQIFLREGVLIGRQELWLDEIRQNVDSQVFTAICREIPHTNTISNHNRCILMNALPGSRWYDLSAMDAESVETFYHYCCVDRHTTSETMSSVLSVLGRPMNLIEINSYIYGSRTIDLAERLTFLTRNNAPIDRIISNLVTYDRFDAIREHLGWTEGFIRTRCTEELAIWIRDRIPRPTQELVAWAEPNSNERRMAQEWLDIEEQRRREYYENE